MERLAWVEVLDRHGEVASRHPVYAWPVRIGRSYRSDIVLDDPHAAADHAEIRPADEGLFEFKCGETANGLRLKGHRGKKDVAVVSGDGVVRVGHTPLRVRSVDYVVAAETPLPGVAWLQGWIGLVVAVLAFMLVQLLDHWLEYTRADAYAILVTPLLSLIPGFVVWAGLWSLIGRVTKGRANYIAHLVAALLFFTLLHVLLGLTLPYLEYALDAEWVDSVGNALVPVALGAVLYTHLSLVSRLGRRKLGLIVAGLMGIFTAYMYLDEVWSEDKYLGRMTYSRALGPARLLVAEPQPAEAFLNAADKLKAEADR